MTTLLLIIIYICFIGLGLPDSLFGTSWPAMYPEFHLPVSYANYATTINCLGTIVASLCSAHVIKKLGTGGVTVLSTGLTAAALLGIAFSENYIWICLFSIPLGLGAGAIDTALNNYVAMHYNATHMNFLHCFYGVGISLSPYLMSLALTDDAAWRDGYCMVFYVQTGITLVALIALPLWKRVKFADNTANTIAEITNETCTATDTTEKADVGGCSSNETDSLVHDTYNETNSLVHDTHTSFTNDDDIVVLSYKEMLKHPGIVTACFAFMGSCALEALCNIWGATYLVNAKGYFADAAAKLIMLYYIGFTLGRFLSGVLAKKLNLWTITYTGLGFCFAGVVLMFLPLPGICSAIGLCMIGFGIGPFFPNLTHLTPSLFGKQISQSVIGAQMASSYVAYLVLPLIFGQVARHISITLYPYFLAVMFGLTIICLMKLQRSNLRKHS